MQSRRALALLAAPALLAATACGAPGAAAAPTPVAGAPAEEAGVRVAGVGSAAGVPDVLRVMVAVESTAPTVEQALQDADAAARRVLDALADLGVAERDVQTVDLQLHSRSRPDGEQADGYVARQTLAVTLRDLEEAGATIGAAVEAGGEAARLQGLTFALEDDTALREQARDEAFADARRVAEQYAELAGRELGRLVSVEEQAEAAGPGPVPLAETADAGSVPLAPGTTEVTVTAHVRWALE
ncbi:SIMPL domain-containing protein [Blastococcus montanus]|uniref:SIMPL domain-containing protein n=1 Tax=Blastococcus montanus TaxID=3144973 RepID=UPI00320AFE82